MTHPLDALLELEASPLAQAIGPERRADDVARRYAALIAFGEPPSVRFRPAELADLVRLPAPEGIIVMCASDIRNGFRNRLATMHLEPAYVAHLSRKMAGMDHLALMKLLELIQTRQAELAASPASRTA